MLNTLNILYKIFKDFSIPLPKNRNSLVIAEENDPRISMVKKYYENIVVTPAIPNISLLDILSRRFRVISIPKSKKSFTFFQKIKLFLIRVLFLKISSSLSIYFFHKEVMLPHENNRIFIFSAPHIAPLLEANIPNFSIHEGKRSNHIWLDLTLYLISKHSKTKLIDLSPGFTIFINTSSFWLLKLYRYLHPNKTIILRYHDQISEVFKCRSPLKAGKFLFNRLQKESIVDYIESYSKAESKLLDIDYRPNGINGTFFQHLNINYRIYLYNFSGSPSHNRSRTAPLNEVIKTLKTLYPQSQNRIVANNNTPHF